MSLDESMLKYYYLNAKVLLILKLYFRISTKSTQIGIKCSLFKTSCDISFLLRLCECETPFYVRAHLYIVFTSFSLMPVCLCPLFCLRLAAAVRWQTHLVCQMLHCSSLWNHLEELHITGHTHSLHGYDCHIIKSLSTLSMIHPLSNQ